MKLSKLSSLTSQTSTSRKPKFGSVLVDRVREELEHISPSTEGWNPWTPNPGPQTMALHSSADELYYGGQAGGGKALDLKTPIPIPAGWTLMSDIAVGDEVFDDKGAICRVTATSEIFTDHDCFELEFDDGEKIIADAEHRWATLTHKERGALFRRTDEWREYRRKTRPRRGNGKRPDLAIRNATNKTPAKAPPLPGIHTTRKIAETVVVAGRTNHCISVADALVTAETVLPIPPYTLGAWLGDGNSRRGAIYVDEPDEATLQCITHDGFKIRSIPSEPIGWAILGLQKLLRLNCLIANKHIPAIYLRASGEQRLALLRGLMDTDGTCDNDGGAEFTSTNKRLANGTLELARSLGLKPTMTEGRAMLYGKDCGPKYRVKITTDLRIFNLERKAAKQKAAVSPLQRRRFIIACEKIAAVPVRCIAVDSPSHLYLAGRSMVPTHNTDLLIGLALTVHSRSVIFRREEGDLEAIIGRTKELVGNRPGLNESKGIWRRLPGGRTIEFAGMQLEKHKDSWQGRPHDLYAFDEIPQFSKTQYQFVTAWSRSSIAGQRCRIVCAGNPPMDESGDWVTDHWAPWLKSDHPNPAQPGELRWFVKMADGEEVELLSGDPIDNGKEIVTPRSRTFIPASIEDNPVYRDAGYRNTINNLPEPLRSQLLGDFQAAKVENPYQVFPAAWIRAAQARWTERKPDVPLSALGNDGARGGSDKMVNSMRFANWLARQRKYPGKEVKDGPLAVTLIVADMGGDMGAIVNIDVVGVGSSIFDHARGANLRAVGLSGGEASKAFDKTGRLGFVNKRAEWHWKFREMLDPTSGQDIALPPDPELFADLCAPRWSMTARGIKIEPKLCDGTSRSNNCCIKHRIGRSPDCGESCIYAFVIGDPFGDAEPSGNARAEEMSIGSFSGVHTMRF